LGFVWDIGECLIQRCFGYCSEDVRVCYEELRVLALDPSIHKVIVIAHSQGGIIISLTLDRMFAEIPPAAMSKLEIYTFGSAAAHFNNPLRYSSYARQLACNEHDHHSADLSRRRKTDLPWIKAASDGMQSSDLIPTDRQESIVTPLPDFRNGTILGSDGTSSAGSSYYPDDGLFQGIHLTDSLASTRTHSLNSIHAVKSMNSPDSAPNQLDGYTTSGSSDRTDPSCTPAYLIPVIEHYVNEYDMVPRWGVLSSTVHSPQHRYAGSVFIHRGASGHLFNRHYLDTMFPLNPEQQDFLNTIVDIDERTARARARSLARSVTMGLNRLGGDDLHDERNPVHNTR
jgi:hypothetical protein